MIFIIAIIAIFFLVIVYLYFRTEKLQLSLRKAQSADRQRKKENKALSETLMLVANTQETFIKTRLQQLKEKFTDDEAISQDLALISPFLNNYAIIFTSCLKGKGQLSTITKKCYDSLEKESYKKFVVFINQQDQKTKRMWNSNTLSGYISLSETLLQHFELTAKNKKLAKAS